MGKLRAAATLCHLHAVLGPERTQLRIDHFLHSGIVQRGLLCAGPVSCNRCSRSAQCGHVESDRKSGEQQAGMESNVLVFACAAAWWLDWLPERFRRPDLTRWPYFCVGIGQAECLSTMPPRGVQFFRNRTVGQLGIRGSPSTGGPNRLDCPKPRSRWIDAGGTAGDRLRCPLVARIFSLLHVAKGE